MITIQLTEKEFDLVLQSLTVFQDLNTLNYNQGLMSSEESDERNTKLEFIHDVLLSQAGVGTPDDEGLIDEIV